MTKKVGAPTQTIIYSPDRQKRIKKAMKKQEEKWRKMNGPVTVRKLSDSTET